MSITNDIRAYADSALEQGKQVFDQAQAQLSDVTEQANGFVGKLTETAKGNAASITTAVSDLRTQAEKAFSFETIMSALEPYLAQAKGYTQVVTDRANDLFVTVKSDKRVAKIVDSAESISGVVVETVQDRVVKPVQSLTKRESSPVAKKTTTRKPAAKPATTRPSVKPATKATARKAPAKKTTATASTNSTNGTV
jgi:hypothetical protein